MLRRHLRTSTAALLACLALVFAVGCATDRPESTWGDLEQIASTFPVPDGFTVIEMERKGELCRMPDCEKPRVALRMAPTERETPDELCAALEQSLDQWEGFTYDEQQSADPTGCSINGQIDGKDVNGSAATAGELARGETPLIVSVWA